MTFRGDFFLGMIAQAISQCDMIGCFVRHYLTYVRTMRRDSPRLTPTVTHVNVARMVHRSPYSDSVMISHSTQM